MSMTVQDADSPKPKLTWGKGSKWCQELLPRPVQPPGITARMAAEERLQRSTVQQVFRGGRDFDPDLD